MAWVPQKSCNHDPSTLCSTPSTRCGTPSTLCRTPSTYLVSLVPCVVPLVPCVVSLVGLTFRDTGGVVCFGRDDEEGTSAMVATLRNHNAHSLNVGISCSTEGKTMYCAMHQPSMVVADVTTKGGGGGGVSNEQALVIV